MNDLQEKYPENRGMLSSVAASETARAYRSEERLPETLTSPKREINIQPIDFGYIVRVGCQTVAVETKEKLISKLTEYINDPVAAEKDYYNGKLL